MARKGLNDDLNRFFGPTKRDDLDFDRAIANASFNTSAKTQAYEPCYVTHRPLKIPGCDLVIYGGSCCSPTVLDADIYIGFDHGMKFTARAYPWNPGTEFLFPITDMSTPKNPEAFRALVEWTADELRLGKKVHAGCIGGHGRTGLFFAALVRHMTGEPDAISYVRKHYCHRAVETSGQVDFLHKHFGIEPVDGSKGHVKIVNGKKSKPAIQVPAKAYDVITHLPGYSIWA